VPPKNIVERFLECSIEVRIFDYNGKNLIFAIPRTENLLRPQESKVIQKENKLIISIMKNVPSDNWSSLHKVNCIGEKYD
jgi:hypothetical protein